MLHSYPQCTLSVQRLEYKQYRVERAPNVDGNNRFRSQFVLGRGKNKFFFPRERPPITYRSSKTRLNVRQILIPVFLYAVHRCNFNIRLSGIIIKFTQPALGDLKTYILRTRAPRSKEWEWKRAEYLCIKVIPVSSWENRTVNAPVPWQLSNYVDHTRPTVCRRSNQ